MRQLFNFLKLKREEQEITCYFLFNKKGRLKKKFFNRRRLFDLDY